MYLLQVTLSDVPVMFVVASIAALLSLITYIVQKLPHFKFAPILGSLALLCPLVTSIILGVTLWATISAVVLGIYLAGIVLTYCLQSKSKGAICNNCRYRRNK